MTTTIKYIVSEAIFQARCEASSVDRTMNLDDVLAEVAIIVDTINFDTAVAKNMFTGFIATELQKVAPYLYPVKMQMDQHGNYTPNSTLWA